MRMNVHIDRELLREARTLGGHRTNKAPVEDALREYVPARKLESVLQLFGRIDYDPGYDYKKERNRPLP